MNTLLSYYAIITALRHWLGTLLALLVIDTSSFNVTSLVINIGYWLGYAILVIAINVTPLMSLVINQHGCLIILGIGHWLSLLAVVHYAINHTH